MLYEVRYYLVTISGSLVLNEMLLEEMLLLFPQIYTYGHLL